MDLISSRWVDSYPNKVSSFSPLTINTVVSIPSSSTNNAKPTELTTTDKIEIVNNRLLLPHTPLGSIAFNMVFVYDELEGNQFIDEITIVKIGNDSYVQLPESATGLNGKYGVVSYLANSNP